MTQLLDDQLIKLLFERAGVRAHLVQLGPSWRSIRDRHPEFQDHPAVLGLLGDMTAASVLLSAALKYDGALVLQVYGDGPVRLAVAECNAELALRSTLRLATREGGPAPVIPAQASLVDLVNQHGKGRFSLVLDPNVPHQQPYQGIVSLEGERLSEAIEAYMVQSEQIPTRLWLASDGQHAAGLLLQQMPVTGGSQADRSADQTAERLAFRAEAWERLCLLADTITAQELLATPAETLLYQLFWEERPQKLLEASPRFYCPCSRERVGRMLNSLGIAEIESILAEQGSVSVQCDFCNTGYQFDPVDCARLFTAPTIPEAIQPGSALRH